MGADGHRFAAADIERFIAAAYMALGVPQSDAASVAELMVEADLTGYDTNSRAGVMQINRSLVEMAHSFGASPIDAFIKVYFWAALPEILGGVRIGVIRAVKGVIIGQLLISIVGFGALFELYSSNFLMAHFWAVLVVLFALAFTIAEFLAYLERRVAYYAAKR